MNNSKRSIWKPLNQQLEPAAARSRGAAPSRAAAAAPQRAACCLAHLNTFPAPAQGHAAATMPFKRYVEIGRVAMINYGPECGTLVVISDVVDQNRVSSSAQRRVVLWIVSDMQWASRNSRCTVCRLYRAVS